VDAGNEVDIAYLDFSKAFDVVPNQRLLDKIRAHGITGKVATWIQDFLSNRQQRVQVQGATSTWSQVHSGVPQGSVIGPILFCIYINDLPDSSIASTLLFADDSKAYSNTNDDPNKLQDDLDSKHDWSDDWLLRFNASKCKLLHLGKASGTNRFQLGDQVIEEVQEEKDLGVFFDSKLAFDTHINMIVTKANRTLGIIKRKFKHLDAEAFVILYKTKVRSILEYASPVWSPHLKKHIRKLERVQARATKMVTGLRHSSYPSRLRTLGLPTLEYRRERADLLEVYKLTHGISKLNQELILPPLLTSTTRGHSLKLTKQRCATTKGSHILRHRVVNNWNNLPDSVVNAPSINAFKSRLNLCYKDHPLKFHPSTAQ
jgi:hypothetical protein